MNPLKETIIPPFGAKALVMPNLNSIIHQCDTDDSTSKTDKVFDFRNYILLVFFPERLFNKDRS